jgi:hypothetical protein
MLRTLGYSLVYVWYVYVWLPLTRRPGGQR